MTEEEKVLKYLRTMRIIDFKKLGFVYGKETIDDALKLIKNKQSELEKKDKMIDEMASQIYLTKEQREKMKEYIWTSNKPKDFKSFVKQYFERKVKDGN